MPASIGSENQKLKIYTYNPESYGELLTAMDMMLALPLHQLHENNWFWKDIPI